MELTNVVEVRFDNFLVYVDIENKKVYSARKKLLSPYVDKKEKVKYYNILYNGRRCKRSERRLLTLANEQK